ncbi:energy transducer TonB [bacterium]|nr:energy transducer TonB [bacterium]
MTWDRTTGFSFGITFGLHIGLIVLFSGMQLQKATIAEMPMLIEVTLAGSSAPKSVDEGVKAQGDAIGSPVQDETGQTHTPEEIAAWREKRRQQIIRELSRDRTGTTIGAGKARLRQSDEKLAEGRGAGDWGTPGSPTGTLSLSGDIAARGYKEPDFSTLKTVITEETRLRLTLVVLPEGDVKTAILLETSGYPYVDQKAIELARKILFDPLPNDWQQVEQQGVLTIKLKL